MKIIVGMLCDKHGAHLMTAQIYDHFFKKITSGQMQYLKAGFERFAMENGKVQELHETLVDNDDFAFALQRILLANTNFDDWGEAVVQVYA